MRVISIDLTLMQHLKVFFLFHRTFEFIYEIFHIRMKSGESGSHLPGASRKPFTG